MKILQASWSLNIISTIMDEVNHTANNFTEEFEEAAYVEMVATAVTEVIDDLAGGDPCSPVKRLKNIYPHSFKPLQIQL